MYINFRGLLNAKPLPCRRTLEVLLTSKLGEGNKGVHAFTKGIRLRANVMMPLEFELTHYAVTVQHVNHYTICTPLDISIFFRKDFLRTDN